MSASVSQLTSDAKIISGRPRRLIMQGEDILVWKWGSDYKDEKMLRRKGSPPPPPESGTVGRT